MGDGNIPHVRRELRLCDAVYADDIIDASSKYRTQSRP